MHTRNHEHKFEHTRRIEMPQGKGTYGRKRGAPKKKKKGGKKKGRKK